MSLHRNIICSLGFVPWIKFFFGHAVDSDFGFNSVVNYLKVNLRSLSHELWKYRISIVRYIESEKDNHPYQRRRSETTLEFLFEFCYIQNLCLSIFNFTKHISIVSYGLFLVPFTDRNIWTALEWADRFPQNNKVCGMKESCRAWHGYLRTPRDSI